MEAKVEAPHWCCVFTHSYSTKSSKELLKGFVVAVQLQSIISWNWSRIREVEAKFTKGFTQLQEMLISCFFKWRNFPCVFVKSSFRIFEVLKTATSPLWLRWKVDMRQTSRMTSPVLHGNFRIWVSNVIRIAVRLQIIWRIRNRYTYELNQ